MDAITYIHIYHFQKSKQTNKKSILQNETAKLHLFLV